VFLIYLEVDVNCFQLPFRCANNLQIERRTPQLWLSFAAVVARRHKGEQANMYMGRERKYSRFSYNAVYVFLKITALWNFAQ
jgi:hypothetical protein